MELAVFILALVIMAAVVLHQVLAPQDVVGEIEGSQGPLGMLGVDVRLGVTRLRPKPGEPPDIRIAFRARGGLYIYTLGAPIAKKWADLLEKAAAAAIQPPANQAPFSGNPGGAPVGNVKGLRVGLVTDRGMGIVAITWSNGRNDSRACFSPGDVEELATMLRIAAQPGANLEAAERFWSRLVR